MSDGGSDSGSDSCRVAEKPFLASFYSCIELRSCIVALTLASPDRDSCIVAKGNRYG